MQQLRLRNVNIWGFLFLRTVSRVICHTEEVPGMWCQCNAKILVGQKDTPTMPPPPFFYCSVVRKTPAVVLHFMNRSLRTFSYVLRQQSLSCPCIHLGSSPALIAQWPVDEAALLLDERKRLLLSWTTL